MSQVSIVTRKGKRKALKPIRMEELEVNRLLGADGQVVDSEHELISLLLPPAVKAFFAELEGEVLALCGGRYSRNGMRARWGSQPGSIVMGNQRVALRKPRVRDLASAREVPLATYARFQDPAVFDRQVFAEGLKHVSVRDYAPLPTPTTRRLLEYWTEAVQGVGYDLLIVCGFAFDPHVAEETKRYGKLTVLTARMNNDLMMSDELLKKTGAGNLFMVFGEPTVDVKREKDGKVIVTLKGLDVYDPTTGVIRSNSTNDIACWFIDTDYNGESFFVRHAYFTGAEEPYDRLKRALRAEIDESAWAALYSTVSHPFLPPSTGKIALKVINHYGDEVLKVYEVK